MVTIAARLAALEHRRPRAIEGQRVTTLGAAGAVVSDLVIVAPRHPAGEPDRCASVEAFDARYPTGQITRQVIFADSPEAPDPNSLYAIWHRNEP